MSKFFRKIFSRENEVLRVSFYDCDGNFCQCDTTYDLVHVKRLLDKYNAKFVSVSLV
jgi:hypothetical protein